MSRGDENKDNGFWFTVSRISPTRGRATGTAEVTQTRYVTRLDHAPMSRRALEALLPPRLRAYACSLLLEGEVIPLSPRPHARPSLSSPLSPAVQ